MGKRRLVQVLTAAIYNPYLKGFYTGHIYQGKSKSVCVPGLNCYSCPGAVGACPIGSLQAVIGSSQRLSLYVAGFLVLAGTLFGRFICGWACPFGFIQELLHKIPGRKIKHARAFRWLKYLKYAFLVVFVIALPALLLIINGVGVPAFCAYICPAGTLEAGIPLVALNESLRSAVGWLFDWKVLLAIAAVILSVFIFRPFCRFVCPLGAIYALFNKISFIGLRLDKPTCTNCGACAKACSIEINPCREPNSPECIRCCDCVRACPTGALSCGVMRSGQTKENKKT